MRSAILLSVLLLFAATQAEARTLEHGTRCINEGVVVQATVFGKNEYCRGAYCQNHGIILLVGETYSCHGYGTAAVFCLGEACGWLDVPGPVSSALP